MNTKKEQDLLNKIREDYKNASEYYSEQRSEAEEDFKFRNGDQWPIEIKRARDLDQRPSLVINKIAPLVRQVVNNQKKNRPCINVNPGDSQAKIEVAKIMQAIIKSIENKSNAENIYDSSFDNVTTCGEGYFRIVTDYVNEKSFDQEILLKPIDNIFSVYIDPDIKSDYSDYKFAFIFNDITKEEFKRLYPNSECSKGNLHDDHDWIREDYVRLTEYFYLDYKKEKIMLDEKGIVYKEKDYNELDEENKKYIKIKKTRDIEVAEVKWVKTNGYEILEESVFPGEKIPVVPVWGDTYYKNGKRIFEGIVRQAKDPQRAYNYYYSNETEQIALAPRAPFIGVEGQFEGHEGNWANANTRNLAYLEYKQVSHNGQAAPAPMRTPFDPQIQSIVGAKMAASEDLKAATGIYDPSLGNEKIEASGKAIISRQRQAEITNFVFIDNLAKALKYAGKILLNIIPIVYDTERVIRIKGGVNKDDELVVINSFDEKSEVFLEAGNYDCEITIGPYGENQRQEALNTMISLLSLKPELIDIMGDIFIGKQDWEGAKEISERLKILLPQPLQENNGLPEAAKAAIAKIQQESEMTIQEQLIQMQNMQKLIADLTAEANEARNEANNKKMEIESKERIAVLQARVELQKAGIKEQGLDARLAFTEELKYMGSMQEDRIKEEDNDTLILSGVNDPITENEKKGESNTEDDEIENILSKLKNTQEYTTRMRANG